jgi:hypothetical protein
VAVSRDGTARSAKRMLTRLKSHTSTAAAYAAELHTKHGQMKATQLSK